MTERIMTQQNINAFESFLVEDEKSRSTLEKYMRDVR